MPPPTAPYIMKLPLSKQKIVLLFVYTKSRIFVYTKSRNDFLLATKKNGPTFCLNKKFERFIVQNIGLTVLPVQIIGPILCLNNKSVRHFVYTNNRSDFCVHAEIPQTMLFCIGEKLNMVKKLRQKVGPIYILKIVQTFV